MFFLATLLVLSLSMGFVYAQPHQDDYVLYRQASVTDIHAVNKKMTSGRSFILIDVREPREWRQGVLEQARLIPRGQLPGKIKEIAPSKHSEIVLYCRVGYRSQLAANKLREMGYTNVRSMRGGINAWQQAGYKIKK